MHKRNRKGFSLLEVIFTVGLLGVTTGLFMVSGAQRLKSKPAVTALANAVANDLGQARLLAMRQLSPVAVVFPSNSQGPHSSSLYQLEGLTCPRITRSQNFSGEYPNISFFIGSWNPGESTTPLVVGTKWTDFNVSQWLDLPNARKNDSAFVFLPDGTVQGRRNGAGLPQFGGEYHIAVCAGVTYSADHLNSAGETMTVCINGGGAIHVESGLTGSSIVTKGSMQSTHDPAAPVHRDAIEHAMGDPKGSSTLPAPPDTTTPTTIPPDGFATVTAFAEDTNKSGERLFCRWKVLPPAGRDDGVFSIPLDAGKGAAMDFNPDARVMQSGSPTVKPAYQSSYMWRPPANAQPGDIFKLQLTLQNQATGEWQDVGVAKKVQITPYGAVLFQFDKAGKRRLYRMKPDGTGKRLFHIYPSTPAEPIPGYNEFHPAASADGSRVAFLSDNRPQVTGTDIFLTDRAGATCTRVTQGLHCESVGLSPDGARVVFKDFDPVTNKYNLYTAPVYPMNVPPYTNRKLLVSDVKGINNTTGLQKQCYSEDRLAWTSNNEILFCGDNSGKPWILRQRVNPDGTPDGTPHAIGLGLGTDHGCWAAQWSSRFNEIYSTIDGGTALGDPLIGVGDSSTQNEDFSSEFAWDTQPSVVEYNPGQKGLIWVRAACPDNLGPGSNLGINLVRNLPAPSSNPMPDAQIVPLTGELSSGNAWFPVYLR
ncbi:MAG: hypothetical protein U0931_37595 [Vulcanimicrobiota bacterium]